LKLYYKFNFATEPEKTPKWLEERTYEKTTQNEYDPQLEKEREAFLKQLQVDWEE
ncbi:replication protein Rep, partial [Staphylococcus warneri]